MPLSPACCRFARTCWLAINRSALPLRSRSGSVKKSPASREPAGCVVARRADDAYLHGNTRRRRNDATAHPAELGGGEGFLHRPSGQLLDPRRILLLSDPPGLEVGAQGLQRHLVQLALGLDDILVDVMDFAALDFGCLEGRPGHVRLHAALEVPGC